MDTGSTSQRLLDEELAGRLSRLPGGRWQRIR
jgi:ABC-type cobalamin transport system ATPase subunit